MKLIKITSIAIVAIIMISVAFAIMKKQTFQEYIAGVKKEAISKGLSPATANKYLDNLKSPKPPKKSVYIKIQKHQAQAVLSFQEYKKNFITKVTLFYGKIQYRKNLKLLKQIEKEYPVQPRFVVALWGIESGYGRHMGNFPLIRSLAILAYNRHRSDYFRQELINALTMLDRPKVIPQQLKSAWDGGMGQAQFEPSSYLYYAVDYDKDGFKNIWTSRADILASIANFLYAHGWNNKETWGIRVKLPKNFPIKDAGRSFKYTIKHWKDLGVLKANGKPLDPIKGKTAILLPEGIKGEAYLVYPNFKVLLHWNNTTFEGLSTGLLSDKFIEKNGKHK